MARRLSRHWDVCHHWPGLVRAAASPRRCISRRGSVARRDFSFSCAFDVGPGSGL